MAETETLLRVRGYELDATLDSGQVFRWHKSEGSWIGVVGKHWVRLTQTPDGIRAETAIPVQNWNWLRNFLQTGIDLAAVLKTFPDDVPMRAAVAACRGLRVLRQEPWECLASFILSSTKQIVQIRQVISLLCERFGEPLTPSLSPLGGERETVCDALECCKPLEFFPSPRPSGERVVPARRNRVRGTQFSFPTPTQIATATESELRACKMGFRAPHLLAAARQIADGKFDLDRPRHLPLVEARAELMKLRGVGGKIADCALLFAYGFDAAFPVDVWVERALRQLYFPRRRISEKRLRHFAATHFGPHAGYAQQYLFHYMRTKMK